MKSILILIAILCSGCHTARFEATKGREMHGSYEIKNGNTTIIHRVWVDKHLTESEKDQALSWAKENVKLLVNK